MFDATPQQAQAKTDALEWARGYIALYGQPAWTATVAKIEAMANEPIPIGTDVAGMAAAIGRMNGIREISRLLDKERARAQRVLDTIIGD